METALRVFGSVKGLAAGPSGEVSPHFEEFVKKLAEKAGERRWQIMGARSQREATATYVQSFRRQISILLSRTMAQLMFDRLNLVVYGDRATEVERQKNKRSFAQWEEEDYYNRHGPQVDEYGQFPRREDKK